MSIKSLFYPEKLNTFQSKYNGQINLYLFLGKRSLEVGGLTQSGQVMQRIWGGALRKLIPRQFHPKNILLLGLGGGSALPTIHARFPSAVITAVEIDPVMIDIAKNIFKVDKYSYLKIINADVRDFFNKKTPHYDLIIDDCFQGFKIPHQFTSIPFLSLIKSKCDYLLINRLYWKEHVPITDALEAKLAQKFDIVTHKITFNKIFRI